MGTMSQSFVGFGLQDFSLEELVIFVLWEQNPSIFFVRFPSYSIPGCGTVDPDPDPGAEVYVAVIHPTWLPRLNLEGSDR